MIIINNPALKLPRESGFLGIKPQHKSIDLFGNSVSLSPLFWIASSAFFQCYGHNVLTVNDIFLHPIKKNA
jgi:hypothetical protein